MLLLLMEAPMGDAEHGWDVECVYSVVGLPAEEHQYLTIMHQGACIRYTQHSATGSNAACAMSKVLDDGPSVAVSIVPALTCIMLQ